jgi:hypothetical protein
MRRGDPGKRSKAAARLNLPGPVSGFSFGLGLGFRPTINASIAAASAPVVCTLMNGCDRARLRWRPVLI